MWLTAKRDRGSGRGLARKACPGVLRKQAPPEEDRLLLPEVRSGVRPGSVEPWPGAPRNGSSTFQPTPPREGRGHPSSRNVP